MFENETTARADVVFPAESHAEKEGTVTHPDGRVQRLRPGVPDPGAVRMGWEVLVELSAALGDELGLDSGPMVLERLAGEVPFYAGLTHEEIGAMGARWQQRDAAATLPSAAPGPAEPPTTTAAEPPEDSRLRLGTYRDLWAGACGRAQSRASLPRAAPDARAGTSRRRAAGRGERAAGPGELERLRPAGHGRGPGEGAAGERAS